MKIMNFSEANCHQCYKCVRTCKVKAIQIDNNQAHIVSDLCIACGQCFASCPQNARNIHSDLSFVKKIINKNKRVNVSIAPSFRGFFKKSEKLITALKDLGFNLIEETAVGADITSKLYREHIENIGRDTYITTCCPSIILLIERYFPNIIDKLMPFSSPMIAHGSLLKKRFPNEYTVFIGPCISKKCESISKDNSSVIDAVLTFDEVLQWLKDEGIDYLKLHNSGADGYGSSSGQLYPVSGGILEGLKELLMENNLTHIRVDGVDDCSEIFNEIQKGNITNTCIEVSACSKSCLGGPSGSTVSSSTFERVQRLKRYLNKVDGTTKPLETKCILSKDKLITSFTDKSLKQDMPSNEEILRILRSLEKHTLEDQLNCGGCGYDTCVDKAISIYRGMSHSDMCIHYVKSCNEKISNEIFENSPNALVILDEDKGVIDTNISFSRIFGIAPSDIRGRLLESHSKLEPLLKFIEDRKRILWEKISFDGLDLYMRLSLIPIDSRKATLLILTDITKDEMRKNEIRALQEKTLEITQDVVVKQMRVAQEIASLLGETTAETKVALNKVRDVFTPEEVI